MQAIMKQVLLLSLFLVISFSKVDAYSGKYVGSENSNKYHYESCRWAKKIKANNLIIFSSAQDAKEKGYIFCKVCNPPSK